MVHFSSRQPALEVAAHEATHVLQHVGATRDGGLGAEGHARQVEALVATGRDARPLFGGHGNAVAGTMHGFGRWDLLDDEDIADAVSRTPEATAAKKEREYEPSGAIAARVGSNDYRFWGFDVDSAVPKPEFADVVNEIADRLRDDPEATVLINGHTSASGGEGHNTGLSIQRANAIMNEIKLRGLVTQHYFAFGKGEGEPLVDESAGPAAMARNRRVEVTIIPGALGVKDEPDIGEDQRGWRYSCADAEHWIRVAKAKIQVWGVVEASARRPSGRQTMGWGQGYVQPDRVDWTVACGANGVSRKWCDYLYDTLMLPEGYPIGNEISALHDEIRSHERNLDTENCDPHALASKPPSEVKKKASVDDWPEPGTRDGKGRAF